MYKKHYVIKATIALTMLVTSSLAISNTAKADTNNNLPYNNSSKSFKNNINNFFTADTWYRPKKINYNGKRWINSKSNDYRPLLTVWWPNQDIKLNYVNYMIDKGLGNNIQSNDSIDQKVVKIQSNIEKKIKSENNVNWLNNLINDFINSQDIWNKNSETPLDVGILNGLQDGGLLSYGNNKLTNYANSNFRLFDRNGLNQNGSGQAPGAELLLSSDIDNSNPTVQSEQLNWLHYIMNFGSINKKGTDGNFDSIRIDAPANIDSDINDIASSYFKTALKASKNEYDANNHISISEAGQNNNTDSDRLLFDPHVSKYQDSLTGKPDQRQNLNAFAESNVNMSPSYTFVNTHDHDDASKLLTGLEVDNNKDKRTKVNNAIGEARNKLTLDQLRSNKELTSYNIPSSYAVMLTDKNVVPRVNYGDLYSETSRFMAKKTPYFDAIAASMKARKQYVAGDENKYIQNLDSNSSGNNQLLISARNGKSRTEGMAVVLGNNPNLTLNDNDKVKISMGSQHKNQMFRPVLKTTNKGLNIFNNDKNVKNVDIKRTDNNGDFYLNKSDVEGVNNPQVSGYLSTWVPMGAKDNQDARTKPNKNRVLKNKLIYPGDALDSNVIFEGFSNFQTLDKHPNTYKNISKNAKLFSDLGITYYSFPPSYRSDANGANTPNGTSPDTVFENGYGIKDRYDFGYNTPTKYGTANELIQAIKSLHKNNIKAMDDFVPNQVSGLPNKEVVSATRTDWSGNYTGNNAMKDNLYAAQSKGTGKDYQAEYGGKYLKYLKQNYPSIFKQKQISTNKAIDNSGKRITEWSARYLNGSNIQSRGSEYILRNENNGKYYRLGNNQYLPSNILK